MDFLKASIEAAIPLGSRAPRRAFECHRSALWSWQLVCQPWSMIKKLQNTNPKSRSSADFVKLPLFHLSCADSTSFTQFSPSHYFLSCLSVFSLVNYWTCSSYAYSQLVNIWQRSLFVMGGSKHDWTDKQPGNTR